MYRLFVIILSAAFLIFNIGCSQEEQTMPTQQKPKTASQKSQERATTGTKETRTYANRTTVPPVITDPVTANILTRWQPEFDPSKAEYTYILSCIGHPDIEGVAVGFNIRDEVWKRSGGRLFVDYRPLAQLGGERDVLNKLRLGAVQGMLSSSVAAANLDNRLGIVNLPFLIDTKEKLEQFRNDAELFDSFGATLKGKGIMVADFTGYGSYGWATRTPVKSLPEAQKVNFRIAQAPVNTELYKAWGIKFTVMPWPDVPQALQTGVIDGLDQTPIVCSISRKFDRMKNFTFVNYAQGLYIHLINLRWLNTLPDDLRKILLDIIKEESAKSRSATWAQEQAEITKAKANGVQFWTLSKTERDKLEVMTQPIYARWAPRIGTGFINTVKNKLDTK